MSINQKELEIVIDIIHKHCVNNNLAFFVTLENKYPSLIFDLCRLCFTLIDNQNLDIAESIPQLISLLFYQIWYLQLSYVSKISDYD